MGDLSKGRWSEIGFELPQHFVDTLLGDFPDARIRLTAVVADCSAPLLLDSFRFGGELRERTIFHAGAAGAPHLDSRSVLTFDNLSDWNSNEVSLELTSEKTQGSHALRLGPAPWIRLESRRFSTTELTASPRLGFDVFIPELPADYHWFGYMNVFVACPSAGLWRTFVGGQPLHILFDGEYNRLEFQVPEVVLAALNGAADDCQFGIDLATNASFGGLALDNGGFLQ